MNLLNAIALDYYVNHVNSGLKAYVQREPQSFTAQLEQRGFWWHFSHERAVLLAAQMLERERPESAAAAERARMDEVHESRAQRRAAKAVEL